MNSIKRISSIDRLIVRGQLILKDSFHIGSGSASRQSDMALRRTADGHIFIPGSSLAGLLRSTAEDLAPYVTGAEICADRSQPCLTCNLFGWTPLEEQAGKGQAGRLTMLDALPAVAIPPVVEIRDHVGIDRQRGAARPSLFYNCEVAPTNTAFNFEFFVQEPSDDEVGLLMAVMDVWINTGLHLGGHTTSGLGSAVLQQIKWFCLDFSDDEVLLNYLLPLTPTPTWPEYLPVTDTPREELQKMFGVAPTPKVSNDSIERYLPQHIIINLELQAEDPLLVIGYSPKIDSGEERPADAAFITRLVLDENGEPVEEIFLPGSSIKGSLRTRTEQIVRTLDYFSGYATQRDAWKDPKVLENYTHRISACAVTHALKTKEKPSRLHACFGGVRMDTAEEQEEPALYEHSCITCRLFGNTALRGRLLVGDAQLSHDGKSKLFDHVAIDRFTGGAADSKKFDDRPLLPGTRFSCVLELQRPEPWMVGLLALVLKDLNDTDVRIGHATHRGYGRIKAWVTSSTALALPGSQLSAGLGNAGFFTDPAAAGPFQKYNLGLETLFTSEGLHNSASPTLTWLEDCHSKFKNTLKTVQDFQTLGEIKEAQK